MKLELWQLMTIVTWITLIIGVLFVKLLPQGAGIGAALVLSGLFITFGRSALPRLELRKHVPNDRQLQRWSDVLAFGIPAFLLISVGSVFLWFRVSFLSSMPIGFSIGALVLAGYCILVFVRA